jgi:hypothetical protein
MEYRVKTKFRVAGGGLGWQVAGGNAERKWGK